MIDSLGKLNKFVECGEYLNAYDFVNPLYTLTYIIDQKGVGKTYSFMNMCLDLMINQNKNFGWIRNTKTEFETSNVPDSFNTLIMQRGLSDKYKATAKGVYEIVKISEKREQLILKGMFAFMNRPLGTSSQNALKCDTIVWDEFINPDFNKPNMFDSAMKLFDTLKREHTAHVFMLGNKHTTSNDMLEGSGVEFDWLSNQNQVYFDKESSTQAFFIGKHNVKTNEESRNQTLKWSKYNYRSQHFYEGHASAVPNTHVVNWDRNNIETMFKPLWKFTIDNQDFCLGKLTNNCFYIKAMFDQDEFPKVKGWYCFYPTDKTDYNIYLHPRKDTSHFKLIIDAYSNGILYYDWFNTQDVVINRLLYFINILEAPDKNTI